MDSLSETSNKMGFLCTSTALFQIFLSLGPYSLKKLKTVDCRLHFFLMMPTDTNTGVVYALYSTVYCTV